MSCFTACSTKDGPQQCQEFLFIFRRSRETDKCSKHKAHHFSRRSANRHRKLSVCFTTFQFVWIFQRPSAKCPCRNRADYEQVPFTTRIQKNLSSPSSTTPQEADLSCSYLADTKQGMCGRHKNCTHCTNTPNIFLASVDKGTPTEYMYCAFECTETWMSKKRAPVGVCGF